MRNNLPISGREYAVRPDQSLISRTDTSGNINYVNKDFIAVSGFSEDELLGAPHNIVRHPDMPVEAFADMWRALKAGRSWTGMVKNRRKNGDHYWVQANATPIFEGDAVIGYTSVRTVPTRSQIEAAEAAYKKFTTGNARGLTIKDGSVIRTGLLGMIAKLGRLGVAGKIRLALLVLCCAIAGLGAVALTGMESINRSLVTVYEDRTVPMGQLDTVVRLLNRNEIEILQAIVSTNVEDVKLSERQVAENASNIGKTWAAYRTTKLTEQERSLAEKFEKDYQTYTQGALKSTLTALSKADFDEAKRLQKEVMRPTFEPLRRDINELLQLQLTVAKEEAQAARAQYSAFKIGVVIAILAAGAFSALMGWYLARAIVGPLRKAVDVAKQIAACNLTAEIRIQSRDETADLLHALRVMQLSLGNIVQRVRESAGVIASNAAEIATGNMDLSARTEQQASSLEETASSMEELTATVKHNAERSAMAGDLVKQAQDTARIGGNAMEKVVATMESITERSRRVTDIIGVIDGIAFQTNLLALNAAVEAARAGEQGRGFAVVAGEVRSLAQRSAAAAKEIKDLINDSVAQTELGSNEVIHTQQTMGSVMTSVTKVSELMSEIAGASREQASGIEQVGLAVTHLDDVTQQNAALVEQAAAASENLQQNGANLLQEFEVFRVTAGSGAHKSKVPAARLAA